MILPAWLVRNVTYPLHERLCGRPTWSEYLSLSRVFARDRSTVDDICRERLVALLQFAEREIPFYRAWFEQVGVNAVQDDPYRALRQLTPLEKATVRDSRDRMIWTAVPGGPIPYSSGGTTGDTLKFMIDRVRQAEPLAARMFMQSRFGVQPGDARVYLWGSPIEHKGGRIKRLRDRFLNELLIDAFQMGPEDCRRHLATIREFRPRCIYGYPSAITLLAQAQLDSGMPPVRSLALIVMTGEEVTREQITRAREAFGCPVAREYGSREVGLIAHDCPEGAMHVLSPHSHVEFLSRDVATESVGWATDDEHGRGEIGEILCTTLNTRAQPFIRYRVGDVGRWTAGNCRCGLPTPTIELLGGKITGFIKLPDGRLCHGAVTSHVLREEPGIDAFKTYQHEVDRFEVLLVVNASFQSAALDRIPHRYRERFGRNIRVECRVVDEIPPDPSGKRRYVVSHVAT